MVSGKRALDGRGFQAPGANVTNEVGDASHANGIRRDNRSFRAANLLAVLKIRAFLVTITRKKLLYKKRELTAIVPEISIAIGNGTPDNGKQVSFLASITIPGNRNIRGKRDVKILF